MSTGFGEHTKATSFTLPIELYQAVEREALLTMTTVSDIVRQALLAYLSPAESKRVLEEIKDRMERTKQEERTSPTKYPKHKKDRPK